MGSNANGKANVNPAVYAVLEEYQPTYCLQHLCEICRTGDSMLQMKKQGLLAGLVSSTSDIQHSTTYLHNNR
jgi:hypothetical protein